MDALPPEVKDAAKAGINAFSEATTTVVGLAKENPNEAAVVAGSVALPLLLGLILKSGYDTRDKKI